MKPLIIGLAILILYCTFTITSFDLNMHQRQVIYLKHVAEELSISASLFFDYSSYSEGYVVFNEAEGIEALEWQMKKLLRLDANFIPLPNGYWTEKVDYIVYFYDDSLQFRVYNNGFLTDSGPFSYPYLHEDEETFYTLAITDPTVIVKLRASKPRYRASFIPDNITNVCSASHEWKGR